MTLDTVRTICRAMPGATEDLKWGADLAFSVGGKMFCVVNTEPPHQMSFKCTPDDFAELIERDGLIPAPYLARAMWVQQSVRLDRSPVLSVGPRLDVRKNRAAMGSWSLNYLQCFDPVLRKSPANSRGSAVAFLLRHGRS
jgi:predicted DNA-binding protein (MmcQ/YjbR family)